MSIANLQQKLHNRQLPIYNFGMPYFDAVAFAEWLNDAFKNSSFKSFSALAEKTKLQRSTISALANAKPQVLTGKASQPKPETVISLAKALNQDVNKALLLAGHAPLNSAIEKPKTVAEFIHRLNEMGFEIQFDADLTILTPDDLQDLIDSIEANLLVKTKKR